MALCYQIQLIYKIFRDPAKRFLIVKNKTLLPFGLSSVSLHTSLLLENHRDFRRMVFYLFVLTAL
jgi:hypothetical protein